MEDPITFVTRKCPFLHGVAQTQGEAMARKMAINPQLPASLHLPRPLHDEAEDVVRTFQLFHGPRGVVPLEGVPHVSVPRTPPSGCPFHQAGQPAGAAPAPSRPAQPQPEPLAAEPAKVAPQLVSGGSRCPYSQRAGEKLLPRPEGPPMSVGGPPSDRAPAPVHPHHHRSPGPALPLASLSLGAGGWPDFHSFFKPKPKLRKPEGAKPTQPGQGQQARLNSTGAATPSTPTAPLSGSNAAAGSITPSGASAGGTCPMRKWLGPLSGVVFNKQGHLACPEPIIKMRAMLAATKPVRELRPQGLHVKFAAIGLTTALLNVPCGMWREHTDKFSFGWFLAVHATIPFIAMLRKAVIMPKYAILFTVAAAIAGQSIGAKFERKRMLAGAVAGTVAGAVATPVPTAEVAHSARPQQDTKHARKGAAQARTAATVGAAGTPQLPLASMSLGTFAGGARRRVPARGATTWADDAGPSDDDAGLSTSSLLPWIGKPIEVC